MKSSEIWFSCPFHLQESVSGQTRPMELLWSFVLGVKPLQMNVIGNVKPDLLALFLLAQGSSKIGLGFTLFYLVYYKNRYVFQHFPKLL